MPPCWLVGGRGFEYPLFKIPLFATPRGLLQKNAGDARADDVLEHVVAARGGQPSQPRRVRAARPATLEPVRGGTSGSRGRRCWCARSATSCGAASYGTGRGPSRRQAHTRWRVAEGPRGRSTSTADDRNAQGDRPENSAGGWSARKCRRRGRVFDPAALGPPFSWAETDRPLTLRPPPPTMGLRCAFPTYRRRRPPVSLRPLVAGDRADRTRLESSRRRDRRICTRSGSCVGYAPRIPTAARSRSISSTARSRADRRGRRVEDRHAPRIGRDRYCR